MKYEKVEVNSERWFDLTPLLNEEFRDIPDYERLYQVSNYGRIKSLERHQYFRRHINNHIVKLNKTTNGYLSVCLCKNKKTKKFKVHRLVALAFITNSKNLLEINHKNEDKLDNRVENLEWCSRNYNINYGLRNLKHKNKMAKKVNQYDKEGNYIKTWDCIIDVERETNIKNTNIVACCKGKYKTAGGYIWKYFEGDE